MAKTNKQAQSEIKKEVSDAVEEAAEKVDTPDVEISEKSIQDAAEHGEDLPTGARSHLS